MALNGNLMRECVIKESKNLLSIIYSRLVHFKTIVVIAYQNNISKI